MRFSIIDLLITTSICACSAAAGVWLAAMVGLNNWGLGVGFLLGLMFYFGVTPIIYKKFRLRPLLFPRCPHCKDANRHYYFLGVDWRRDLLKCANCHAVLEVWYDVPEKEEVSHELASFQLLWPQSWGRWRAISPR